MPGMLQMVNRVEFTKTNNALNILFITDNFPPEVNAPATRTYEHAKRWVQQGATVRVITCAPNFPQGKLYLGYKNKLYQTENMDGIIVIRVWSYMTSNKGFFLRILDYISFAFSAFLAGLFKPCEVIVATSPQFFTTIAAYSLSLIKRKPWFFEVRDLWPESIRSVGAMDKNSKILDIFESIELFLYRKAKRVIVVTEAFKNNLIQRKIPCEKIDVIPNGCNSKLFFPCETDQLLKRDLGMGGKIVLGYIGTHGMAHGLDFIIHSFKKLDLQRYALLLVGDGAEKKSLISLVAKEKINGVHFLPPIPKSEVPSYISICDICLVPLIKTPTFRTVIPSKIFEVAAMGKPILLGVDGQARQIVEKYGCGIFFEPENEQSFHDGIDQIQDEQIQTSIRLGCKALVRDYNRDSLADRMLNILSSNLS
jgi:glycosyltransferase involved in cell wall biosynthesis